MVEIMEMEQSRNQLFQEDILRVIEDKLPFHKLKNKSVLITGATGLIGSFLTAVFMELSEQLHYDISVTVLCRNLQKAEVMFEDYLPSKWFHIQEGDICQPLKQERDWNYIIHAAGNAHPAAFQAEPVETILGNVTGSFYLLETMRKCNAAGRFLFISSGEIYGDYRGNGEGNGFREEDMGYLDCMNPRACYPEGKRAAETLCAAYAKEYGIDICVARLSYVYGASIHEKNTRADSQFLRSVVAGEDIIMKSDGLQYRSYCYLADAAAGIFTILLKGAAGEAYNIADAQSKATIREYARTLANAGGVKVVFAEATDREKQGYSKVGRAILDASKLETLGFEAKVHLEEGLRRTYRQCVES